MAKTPALTDSTKTITMSEVLEICRVIRPKEHPIFLFVGAPGVGKTEGISETLRNRADLHLVEVPPLDMIETQDLIGIPYAVPGEPFHRLLPPEWLVEGIRAATESGKTLCLLLDEFTRAHKDISNALLRALDVKRQLGSVQLPENTLFVCAGNPSSYRDTRTLSEALSARLVIMNVRSDFDSWYNWAVSPRGNIHPFIVQFLRNNPAFLDQLSGQQNQEALASVGHGSPRNWARVNQMMNLWGTEFHNVQTSAMESKLGDGLAASFITYVQGLRDCPSAVDVLFQKIPFPDNKRPDFQYVVSIGIAQLVGNNPGENFKAFLEMHETIPAEFVVGTIAPVIQAAGVMGHTFSPNDPIIRRFFSRYKEIAQAQMNV
jgi:hypothetical protein